MTGFSLKEEEDDDEPSAFELEDEPEGGFDEEDEDDDVEGLELGDVLSGLEDDRDDEPFSLGFSPSPEAACPALAFSASSLAFSRSLSAFILASFSSAEGFEAAEEDIVELLL